MKGSYLTPLNGFALFLCSKGVPIYIGKGGWLLVITFPEFGQLTTFHTIEMLVISGIGGGLLLPARRSNHGRSMNSLNCCGNNMASGASSLSSHRGMGIQNRTLAAVHNRHLAASTLKLWQSKPHNFGTGAGLSLLARKKSLSANNLQCSKPEYVWMVMVSVTLF